MIRLTRIARPAELTDEVAKELTERYKKNSKDEVWKQAYILSALKEMSFNKCSFCEMQLGEEGKYPQVEHYHPKSIYPDEVVSWDNLLLSCNRCNSNKNSHDTISEPIINPSIDNPKDHLCIKHYRYKWKDDLGRMTVQVLDLNHTTDLVTPRFRITETFLEKTENLIAIMQEEEIKSTPQRRKKIVNTIKDLLKAAEPQKVYSAFIATVIFEDNNYKELKQFLINQNLWDTELVELDSKALSISMCS